MTWVKIDDQFYDHPKMRAAGRDGRDLLIAALCHSSAHLLDGLIADHDLALIAAKAEVRPRPTAKRLVEVDAWHREGHVCDRCPPCPPGAYLIHDYHAYQPSAEQERKRRREVSEAKARAGRKGAAARWGHGTADSTPDGTSHSTGHGSEMAQGVTQPWRSDDPDPEPLTSIVTTAAADTPDARQQRIDEACMALAQERAERRTDHVGQGWIRATARGIASDHHQALHLHLANHPDASAAQLIDLIEGVRTPRRHEPTIPQPPPVADILATRPPRAPADELVSNIRSIRHDLHHQPTGDDAA